MPDSRELLTGRNRESPARLQSARSSIVRPMASQVEIARLAKVSQPIVSRVLAGRAKDFRISEETEARVRAIADALGYRPNQASRMLLGRDTKLIGVIVPLFADLHVGTVLDELNRGALRAGYTLLVVGFEHGEFNAGEIQLLQSYRPDAFVVVGTTDFRRWEENFLNCGKPIIQMGQPLEDERVITCGIDEERAAELHIRHLAELGHRRIGIMGNPTMVSRQRSSLLKNALRRAPGGLALSCFYLSELDVEDAGADGAAYLMEAASRENWPTAIVTTSDVIALGFIQRLGEKGGRVPVDVSVATYNDILIPALVQPSLTTIRQPLRELAAASIEMVTGARPLESLVLPPELVTRASTAAPRVSG